MGSLAAVMNDLEKELLASLKAVEILATDWLERFDVDNRPDDHPEIYVARKLIVRLEEK